MNNVLTNDFTLFNFSFLFFFFPKFSPFSLEKKKKRGKEKGFEEEFIKGANKLEEVRQRLLAVPS